MYFSEYLFNEYLVVSDIYIYLAFNTNIVECDDFLKFNLILFFAFRKTSFFETEFDLSDYIQGTCRCILKVNFVLQTLFCSTYCNVGVFLSSFLVF